MQLVYRGQTFNFQPATDLSAKATGSLKRTLFYRGNVYICELSLPKSRLSKTINWRYSLPCEAEGTFTPAHY
jgi:hypothetical protein